ncbi:MAG: radical SAM protein [bacterium]
MKRIIIEKYISTTQDKVQSVSDFVTKVLGDENETKQFRKQYGDKVLEDIEEYVKKIVKENKLEDLRKKMSLAEAFIPEIHIQSISRKDINISKPLVNYLKDRILTNNLYQTFSFILDLTYFCNLDCIGCGVPVKFNTDYSRFSNWELSFENVAAIIRGIAKLAEKREINDDIRFCLGGGEPTLHPDFDNIVIYAAELLGSQNISFDTNGTILDTKRLQKIAPYVGNIGIGLDGNPEYHNKWRNPNGRAKLNSVFDKIEKLLSELRENEAILNKIEFVFTPTSENWDRFEDIAYIANRFRVKRVSCHRFMLTGKASKEIALEPSPEQYLKLFTNMIDIGNELKLDVHFHHSFEELLCRVLVPNINISNIVTPCKARRASLCISADLTMHFCPWFVAEPFNQLGLSLIPYQKIDENNRKYYDINDMLVHYSRKYTTDKCICPIASANIRLLKFEGEDLRFGSKILTESLLAEDTCENQLKYLFQQQLHHTS